MNEKVFGAEGIADIKKSDTEIIIDPAKTALLMLHWQNHLVDGSMSERLAEANTIKHATKVLDAARKKGMLVIYVNAAHRPGYPEISDNPFPLVRHLMESGILIKGTEGCQVTDQLKPLDDEIVIENYSTSAFTYTELDLILRNKGITTLALTGLTTNYIVESTTRDGANRGYLIYILDDCCLSLNDEIHTWTLTNILPTFGYVFDSETFIAKL